MTCKSNAKQGLISGLASSCVNPLHGLWHSTSLEGANPETKFYLEIANTLIKTHTQCHLITNSVNSANITNIGFVMEIKRRKIISMIEICKSNVNVWNILEKGIMLESAWYKFICSDGDMLIVKQRFWFSINQIWWFFHLRATLRFEIRNQQFWSEQAARQGAKHKCLISFSSLMTLLF